MEIINTNNCPCMNCTDREYRCHSSCDKYKDWKELLNKAKYNDSVFYTRPLSRREELHKNKYGREKYLWED